MPCLTSSFTAASSAALAEPHGRARTGAALALTLRTRFAALVDLHARTCRFLAMSYRRASSSQARRRGAALLLSLLRRE